MKKKHFFTLLLMICFSVLSFGQIAINEIMSSNSTTIKDEDGDFDDWIEIYNYGSTTVNLQGYGLSDEPSNLFKWVFPSTSLAANSYLLVWASSKNKTTSNQPLHTNFKIKSDGETIVLTRNNGTKLDEVPAIAIATDVSYGRKPNGTGSWSFLERASPNLSNLTETATSDVKLAINEIMSSNTSTITDEDGIYSDWIEIYNYGTVAVNMNDFGLSDNISDVSKWEFPSITIQPQEYLIVWASDKNQSSSSKELHTNFKISSGGEKIILSDNNGAFIDESPAVELSANVSYGRKPDGTGDWIYFTTATPDAANTGTTSNTLPEDIEAPTFSHQSGLYGSAFNLSLSTEVQGATIIYTLDGSEPSEDNLSGTSYQYKNEYPLLPGDPFGSLLSDNFTSNTYSSSINVYDRSSEANQLVSKNTHQFSYTAPSTPVRKAFTVRAKTIAGDKESKTASKTFFVWNGGNPYDIPVVSLQIQEDLLFDYENGIYTAGKNFDTWRTENPDSNQSWRATISNYSRSGRDWEYPINVELFEPENLSPVENLNAGLRIHGNNSRIFTVKNLRLYARSDYDDDNEFKHELFDDLIPNSSNLYNNEYKRLFLRGNGAGGSIAYDVAFSRAMQPVYNGVTRIKPVIHFINGEYWGINAFRDRLDKYHYELNFGVESDNFIQISCNGSKCDLDEGESEDYSSYIAMRDFIIDNNMANTQKYNEALEMLDIDSFLDHAIMVIFASNNSYERKYWKARTPNNNPFADGKWRLSVQDFEASLSSNTNWLEYLSDLGRSDNNSLLANLLQNSDFKNQFINRFADILNTVFTKQNFDSVINETFNEINPYLSEDKNRSDRDDFFTAQDKQDLLDWSKDRPAEQYEIIRTQFDIAKNVDITLNLSDVRAGYIKINTIKINPATVGVNKNPYPWKGTYFNDVPVTLEAVAYPGYQFSHWSGGASGTNASITVTPNNNISIQANYTSTANFKQLVYFWLIDGSLKNDTPLESLNATYSRNDIIATLNYNSALQGYPFTEDNESWRKASLERKNSPTSLNYRSIANNEVSYSENFMRGIQVKQPFKSGSLENTIELNVPTTHIEDVKLSLALKTDGAVNTILIDYWNGSQWSTANLANSNFNVTENFTLVEVDFSNVSIADNNANFKIRMRFDGTDLTIEDGKEVVINNIAIEGIDNTPLSADAFELTGLKVYPNPSKNRVFINADEPLENITVYTIFGQVVAKLKPNALQTSINIESFAKGVYLLRASSEKAQKTIKIIKN